MVIKNLSYRFYTALLILAMAVSCTSYNKKQQMQNLLQQAEKMNSEYIAMDTITFMGEVLSYYMSHGTEDERIKANYMMGCVFRDKGESPLALQYYLEAVNQADTTDTKCNFELLSRIYAQMAILFDEQNYPQKSIEMWAKAKNMAHKAGDEQLYAECLAHSFRCYEHIGETAEAIRILKESQQRLKDLGRKEYAASICGELAYYYLKQDSIDMAKSEIDKYIQDANLFNNGKIHIDCVLFYYYLGKYYEKTEQLDSALYYYRELGKYPDEIANAVHSYEGLLSVYAKTHQTDSVVKYTSLYTATVDTATIKKSAEEVCRIQSLYDYSEHQRQAVEKTKEANTLWKTLLGSFVIFILIGIILHRFIIFQKKKSREYKANYLNVLTDYRKAVSEYNQYKADKSAYEEVLRDKIQRLQHALSTYQDDFDIERLSQEQNLHNHKIVVLLHNYAQKAQSPTAQDWNTLLDITRKMLPDFCERIYSHQYQPSEQEFKLCILTRLDFEAYEIYVLLELSKQRVSNMRRRLNQKLFKEKSASTFHYNINRI